MASAHARKSRARAVRHVTPHRLRDRQGARLPSGAAAALPVGRYHGRLRRVVTRTLVIIVYIRRIVLYKYCFKYSLRYENITILRQ